MKTTTAKTRFVPQLIYVLILPTLICSSAIAQQIDLTLDTDSACDAGYAETWIIDSACDLGGKTNIKANDAIHIQCDTKTERWSVDFYEEQADGSQSVRYEICPGNGFLTKSKDGRPMLQCNFWESNDNVGKQLEFVLEPVTDPRVRVVRWLSREQDNPNVICGIAGRPGDDESATTTGQTIVNY